MIGTDAFQEVDTYGMSIPITKHNFLVREARDLLHIIPEAFAIATSGRPGPVLIDIPRDVQLETADFTHWPEIGEREPVPSCFDGDLDAAVEMLNSARRPILWLGGGVVASGAGQEMLTLAERASMPVTATLMGLTAVPHDHPLNMGMLGMHAQRHTNMALEACDLILAAGVRFDDRATGKVQEFCPQAKVIHIDIDHSELDKLRAASVAILGDVREVVGALLPRIAPAERQEWIGYIEALKLAFPPRSRSRAGTTPHRN